MAVVANTYRGRDAWLIDDLIQTEQYGRTIRLRDATTGEVIENIGNSERDFMLNSVGTTYAAAQSSYGVLADAVIRAQYLISSGKWAIHQAGPSYNVTPNNN